MRKFRGRNGDVRCGDCEHYGEEGCEPTAEALVLDGWPRASVQPEHSADASRCPEFEAGGRLAADLDEEGGAAAAHARVSAIRRYQLW